MLVSLYGERGNLSRSSELRVTTPVAVATKGIHVGQHPGGNYEVRLFAGLAQQVEADGDSVELKPYQKLFRKRDMPLIGGGILLPGYGLDERRRGRGGELPPRQEETQTGLFNPGPGIFQC